VIGDDGDVDGQLMTVVIGAGCDDVHAVDALHLRPFPGGLSTLLLSHDRIVCKACLKSPESVTLTNRFPGVFTNIQSLSCAEICVTRNRCLLL